MYRRYLALGLLLVGCGAEAPREPVASTSRAVVGAQIAVEYEQAPAYYGTVAFGANGSYDAMYAVVLTVAFLGFAADRIYLVITRRALAWRE